MAHILLTRPAGLSQSFAKMLVDGGVNPDHIHHAPAFKIALKTDWTPPPPGTLLILTSQNGVRAAAQNMTPDQYRAICVGDKTSRLAQELGFDAQFGGTTVAELLTSFPGPLAPVCHLRGAHTTDDIAAQLTALGHSATQIITYDQPEIPWKDAQYALLRGGTPVVLPLFSPRTAQLVCSRHHDFSRHTAVAISPAVQAVCQQHGFGRVFVAQTPVGPAVLDRTIAAYTSSVS